MPEIPQDTEGCNDWLHELYRDKDRIYDYFVEHGTFAGRDLPCIEIQRNYYDLIIELAWMLVLGVPSVVYLFRFLWTSSLLAQVIFFIVLCCGKQVSEHQNWILRCVISPFSNHRRSSNDRRDGNGTWFRIRRHAEATMNVPTTDDFD